MLFTVIYFTEIPEKNIIFYIKILIKFFRFSKCHSTQGLCNSKLPLVYATTIHARVYSAKAPLSVPQSNVSVVCATRTESQLNAQLAAQKHIQCIRSSSSPRMPIRRLTAKANVPSADFISFRLLV